MLDAVLENAAHRPSGEITVLRELPFGSPPVELRLTRCAGH
jgi:hypothetical protein